MKISLHLGFLQVLCLGCICSCLFFSCGSDPRTHDERTHDESIADKTIVFPLNISEKSITLMHPDCADSPDTSSCTQINYEEVIVSTTGDSVLAGISSKINNAIIRLISQNVSEKPFEDIDSIQNIFFKSWSEFSDEVKLHTPFPWEISVKGSGETIADSIFCYVIQLYSYTGGAHGNSYTQYLCFDIKSQKIIDPLAGLDKTLFRDIAEQYFRKNVGISADADLSVEGFFFDDDEFQLPDEIGMSEDGYILYYNDYEIRPHSEGPLKLVIPYSEFLSHK